MRFAVTIAAVAAGMQSALAGTCDPEAVCEYNAVDNRGVHAGTFTFHDLCKSDGDYMISDNGGHDYYANICGQAEQNCLPASWTNTLEYGVAVQMWGGDPAPGDNCVEKATGKAVACTKDCQVIGHGNPKYSLEDPTNPYDGGVRVAFTSAPPAADDPFFCPFNPSTGMQYPREVHYVFDCKSSAKTPEPYKVQQNSTDNCQYTIWFYTENACLSRPASNGTSAGEVVGIIFGVLIGLFAAYCLVGIVINYASMKTVRMPHHTMWAGVIATIMGPCSKKSASGARGTYEDIGGSQGAGYQGGKSTGAAAGGGNSYTDL